MVTLKFRRTSPAPGGVVGVRNEESPPAAGPIMMDEIQGAPEAMTFPEYHLRKFLENFSAGFDA